MRSQPSNPSHTRLFLAALVVASFTSLAGAQVSSAQGNSQTQSNAQPNQHATENGISSQDAQQGTPDEQTQEQTQSASKASINRSWRIIAHWIAMQQSHISRQLVIDRTTHISRPMSNPTSHGWRVSLPNFSRDEVHMPPAAAARQKLQARSTSTTTSSGKQTTSRSTTQASAGTQSDD